MIGPVEDAFVSTHVNVMFGLTMYGIRSTSLMRVDDAAPYDRMAFTTEASFFSYTGLMLELLLSTRAVVDDNVGQPIVRPPVALVEGVRVLIQNHFSLHGPLDGRHAIIDRFDPASPDDCDVQLQVSPGSCRF